MVATILADEFIETKVFFLTGYSWHWDTDQTGLSIYAYRNHAGAPVSAIRIPGLPDQ